MIWLSTAFAGFYHPAEVASESEVFARASDGAASRGNAAQQKARTLATALVDYEEALDLLGIDDRTRLDALEDRYNRDFAVMQAFVDDQVTRFDGAFSAALDRTLKAHPDAQRCQRDLPAGPRLPGMSARVKRNPDCQGTDLNGTLAEAIDADTTLSAALDALASEPWPDFSVDTQALPVTGDRWVSAPVFFRSQMRDALRTIRREDEDERLTFQAAIEQGASTAELKAMVDQARAVDARTRAKRQAVASPVIARSQVLFTKKAPGAAWCPQPRVLGGCSGVDATNELVSLLLSDKKLQKALP